MNDLWVEIEALATLAAVALAWLDGRRQRERMHQENQTRLAVLEAQLGPVLEWFNNGRSGYRK